MEAVRYLIMAGGKEERWRNHLGTHKHLIRIDGERLLDRTVRLLRAAGAKELIIVAKYPEYEIEGTRRVAPQDLENGGALASADFWAEDRQTTVLFGDVFYTQAALRTICQAQPLHCTFIGRPGPSALTGCPYEELFGFILPVSEHGRVRLAMARVRDALRHGEIKSCGGWALYRHLQGLPLRKRRYPANFLVIDDFTEDFDFPEDYDRWIQNYRAGKRVTPMGTKPRFWHKWLPRRAA